MIGLVGAHRVGKSTLYNHLLTNHRTAGVKISISEMQQAHGYDSSNQEYRWEVRKYIQEVLISSFTRVLNQQRNTYPHTISERTPLDLIGYAVLDYPESPTVEDRIWLEEYITKCIALTNAFYSDVILIQPGIPYVECATSAKEDSMEKLNGIYLAQLLDSRLTVRKHVMPADMLDLDERVKYVENIYDV